jgi:hypothetical protein
VLSASIISAIIALMVEAANTSEMSVHFYQTTRHTNPEDSNLHTRHSENFKSHFIIYLCTKCHINSSNESLAITVKHKSKWEFFHIHHDVLHSIKKITWTEVASFSNICYHTSFQDPILSGTSITLTSQDCTSAMLILIVESTKYEFGVASNGIKFILSSQAEWKTTLTA